MKLLINQDLSQELWDSSLLSRSDHHFLQSWAWGEFQTSLGNSVWYLAIEESGTLLVQLLIVKQSLGLGQSILYSPRGQLVAKQLSAQILDQAARMAIDAITKLAREQKCLLFRIDPPTEASDITAIGFYKSLGFVSNSNKTIQPQYNQIIDLRKGTESVLAAAKPKTRYNINLAKRYLQANELTITDQAGESEIEGFVRLVEKTGSRQGFTTHSRSYIEQEVRLLTNNGMADLISARAQLDLGDREAYDHWIASILVVTFGQTATYVHGGSDSSHRHLMAPYLLHITAIETAVARGLHYYDLGGVNPDSSHKWSGITRFKEGFGGKAIQYVGTLELPISQPLYKLYRLADLFR